MNDKIVIRTLDATKSWGRGRVYNDIAETIATSIDALAAITSRPESQLMRRVGPASTSANLPVSSSSDAALS